MDLHKPKPWHGWRDFSKEFGTIVLGVSVALAAEQGVEWLHWRTQVADAREIIATELATNLASAIQRLRAGTCTERRLDQLAQIVDAAGKTGNLPPLGDIGIAPRSTFPSGAWDSVVASQTAPHFPRQQLAAIAAVYKIVERANEYNPRENESWNQLWTMTGPGRRLDPASESELRKALSNARGLNHLFAGLSTQMVRGAKALNLSFAQSDLDRIAAARSWPPSDSRSNICRPIGPPTAFYGQAANFNITLPNGMRTDMDAAGIDEAAREVPDFSGSAK